MEFLRELQHQILGYLEGKEELSAIREWLAPIVIDIESCDSPQAMRAVYSMQRSISDFAEGFLSEPQLKQNLAALLIPSPSLSSYMYVDIGGPSKIGSTGTATSVIEAASVGVGPALVFA